MGQVYEAWDTQLERRVAIKLVFHGGGAATLEEARCLARIAHPNVVSVHEVGYVANQAYLAMELVDGPNLRRWARGEGDGRARDVSEIVTAIVAAGRGLAAVHDAGLLHGDVKPGNILVGRDDRVRVADFGLARFENNLAGDRFDGGLDQLVGRALDAVRQELEPSWLDSADEEVRARRGHEERGSPPNTTLTVDFEIAADIAADIALGELRSLLEDFEAGFGPGGGTANYMAPERLQPGTDARSPAADQYSLCATAWEVLLGTNYPESQPAWGKRCPALVVAVLRRGLAASPTARWPSIDALCTALEEARDRSAGGLGLLAGGLVPGRVEGLVARARSVVLVGSLALGAWAGVMGLANVIVGDALDPGARSCEREGRAMLSQWRTHQQLALEFRLGQGAELVGVPTYQPRTGAGRDAQYVRSGVDQWIADWVALWSSACGSDVGLQICLERERRRLDSVLALVRELEAADIARELVTGLGSPLDCLDEGLGASSTDAAQMVQIARISAIERRIQLAVLAGAHERAADQIRAFEEELSDLASPELELHRLAVEPWRARLLAATGELDRARAGLRDAIWQAEAMGEDGLRFALLLAQARLTTTLDGTHGSASELPTLDDLAVLEGLAEHVDPGVVARAELGVVRSFVANTDPQTDPRSLIAELAAAEESLRLHPSDPYAAQLRIEILVRRAQLHFDLGEFAQALGAAEAAESLVDESDPDNTRALVMLVRAVRLAGVSAGLLGDCEQVRWSVETLWSTNERWREGSRRVDRSSSELDLSLGAPQQVDWAAVRRACPYAGGDLYALLQPA